MTAVQRRALSDRSRTRAADTFTPACNQRDPPVRCSGLVGLRKREYQLRDQSVTDKIGENCYAYVNPTRILRRPDQVTRVFPLPAIGRNAITTRRLSRVQAEYG